MKKEREKKEKRVCGGRWESGGVRGKLQEFFFFFLSTTYSRVFKSQDTATGYL